MHTWEHCTCRDVTQKKIKIKTKPIGSACLTSQHSGSQGKRVSLAPELEASLGYVRGRHRGWAKDSPVLPDWPQTHSLLGSHFWVLAWQACAMMLGQVALGLKTNVFRSSEEQVRLGLCSDSCSRVLENAVCLTSVDQGAEDVSVPTLAAGYSPAVFRA